MSTWKVFHQKFSNTTYLVNRGVIAFSITVLCCASFNIYAAQEAAQSFINAIRQQVSPSDNQNTSSSGKRISNVSSPQDLSVSSAKNAYILTAPPRGGKDQNSYEPIVKYLERELGVPFVYKKPSSWSRYNSDMRDGIGDIYFHGPQFASWQITNLNYEIVARLPIPQEWVVLVRKDSGIKRLLGLVGKKVCVQGETNYARLTFFDAFEDHPARLPIPIKIKGRQQGYNNVVKRRCLATVVATAEYKKYSKDYRRKIVDTGAREGKNLSLRDVNLPVHIIHHFKPNPNQSFVLSPNIPPRMRKRIQKALLSDEGVEASKNLMKRYAGGKPLVIANNKEYEEVNRLLDKAPLFGFRFNRPMGAAIREYNAHNRR